jgi:hypothetical protein
MKLPKMPGGLGSGARVQAGLVPAQQQPVKIFTPIFPTPKVALNPEPSTNPPSLLLTKAELAIRKAQQALDKTERLEQQTC